MPGLSLACCVTCDLAYDVCLLHGDIVVGAVLYQLWLTSCVAPVCWLLDHYLIGPAAGDFVCLGCVLRVV